MMTTLDKQALEKAWDAYMAAVLAEHPHARFQTQTPEQREENQRFVNTAITAYLDADPARRVCMCVYEALVLITDAFDIMGDMPDESDKEMADVILADGLNKARAALLMARGGTDAPV